jgi:hypothetical protein
VLQGDAYRGYERIADPDLGDAVPRLLAGCCMHARRPCVQALETRDPSAIFFVERFQSIYRIEAEARTRALTAAQRLELRQQRSVPILGELRERAHELRLVSAADAAGAGIPGPPVDIDDDGTVRDPVSGEEIGNICDG